MVTKTVLLLLAVLLSQCQGDVNRLSPIGAAVAKGGIKREATPPPPAIEKRVEVVVQREEDKPPPKGGVIVRVAKSMPIGRKVPEGGEQPRDKSPRPPPDSPLPSPVYPVRPPAPTTVYQGAPGRPTTTVGFPRPILTTNVATNTATAKKPSDDDDDQEDDDAAGKSTTTTKTANGSSNKTTTVQSGDPWGDFVFPTRGPRPDWLRNGSAGKCCVDWLSLFALLLLVFTIM